MNVDNRGRAHGLLSRDGDQGQPLIAAGFRQGAEEHNGRVAAREVLVVTNAIGAIIRDGKTHQIYSAIQTGTKNGMQTMEKPLADLYTVGQISYEDALSKAMHPDEFKNLARIDRQ